MNTKTHEEAAAPLGVIGSLTTGFEMVGQHLWLVVLPVMLDLLLWIGPRLSPLPLLHRFIRFMTSQPLPDSATAQQVEIMVELLEQLGERFNLLSLFSAIPLLDVPSLLARRAPELISPLGEPRVWLVGSMLVMMMWAVVLIPTGLMLGFLYLSGLAHRVRAMRLPTERESAPSKAEGEGPPLRLSSGLMKVVNFFLFSAGLLIAWMILFPLWSVAIGMIVLIAPALGFLAWTISIGLCGYLVLHLLFVVPGVLVGERGLFRATVESFMMVQSQFPSTAGLVLLIVVIYEGLGFIWSLPSSDSWALLVGIVGNGCIVTGLTAATFVFYQERVDQIPKLRRFSVQAE